MAALAQGKGHYPMTETLLYAAVIQQSKDQRKPWSPVSSYVSIYRRNIQVIDHKYSRISFERKFFAVFYSSVKKTPIEEIIFYRP